MGLTGTWDRNAMDAARRKRAVAAFEAALVAGITLYDHADIYGAGTCEEVFADCLEAFPGSREKIQIWTKGGICSGHFNLSGTYIKECIERSLQRMKLDYIDLYQLHRPDPLTHPAETAAALNEELEAGRILAVGVSNYFPEQVRALQQFLAVPLVSNQIQINLLRLDPLYEGWRSPQMDLGPGGQGGIGDGVLDQCLAQAITPLAYSPLAKALLSQSGSEVPRVSDVQEKLGQLARKHDATRTQVALAWLIQHPAAIIPVVGSANPAHIFEAAQKTDLVLDRLDWYALWTAAWGRNVP